MKFSIQRHHKMDIFINLEDVVFGNLLAFFFPLDNVIQDGQLQIRTLKDGFTLLTNINVIIRENNGEIDDGFHASVILAPLLNNAQWHQDFISARFFDHKLSKHLLRGIVSVKILFEISKINGLLVHSQTTLTSFWLLTFLTL
mgnify:CR=1 FL=1